MKKTLFIIIASIAVLMNQSVAQTSVATYRNTEEQMFVEDSVYIPDLGVYGTYNGYLPVVVYYDTIVEWYSLLTFEPIGVTSQYLTIREECNLYAKLKGQEIVGRINTHGCYTRPEQMIPFVDTVYLNPNQSKNLPAIKQSYIPDYISVTAWYRNGEEIPENLYMLNYKIKDLQPGDTCNITVRIYDDRYIRPSLRIQNTYIVICPWDYGTEENGGRLSPIYPNPTRDGLVTIKGNEGETAKVYDLTGRLVMEACLEGKETTLQLPDARGVYLIKTSDGVRKVMRN